LTLTLHGPRGASARLLIILMPMLVLLRLPRLLAGLTAVLLLAGSRLILGDYRHGPQPDAQ
jgi:hypothetical protein